MYATSAPSLLLAYLQNRFYRGAGESISCNIFQGSDKFSNLHQK